MNADCLFALIMMAGVRLTLLLVLAIFDCGLLTLAVWVA